MFDFINIDFQEHEWNYLVLKYLKGWTEIPLNTADGYDEKELKFYDGFFGALLSNTEQALSQYPYAENPNCVDLWKFQGKIYRVLHHVCYDDKKGRHHHRLPKVKYHGMISHWTTDYTFHKLLYKLSDDEKYIILEADTGKHFAFDVNKYRKANNCEEFYTEGEQEIIFPMYKECIKEYHMTIRDFRRMKEQEEKREDTNGI